MVRSFALLSFVALAACAEPIDEDRDNELPEPAPVAVEEPVEPAELGVSEELASDGNVPSLVEVQAALQQCVRERDVVDAQCEATEEGTEVSCTDSLDGDTPETEREAMIAADGDTYVLIDIPEDCAAE